MDTLGISIGTRLIGFAVICDAELVDWGTRTFEGKWSGNKCSAICSALSDMAYKYQVKRLVLKIPREPQYTNNLKELVATVQLMKHTVTICSLPELKERYRANTSSELIKVILKKHPELLHEYEKHERSKNNYHVKVFEAVACTSIEAGL